MGSTDEWREAWVSLVIGSTRCHWAWFHGLALKAEWNTSHLLEAHISATSLYGIPEEMLDQELRDILTANLEAEEAPLTMYIASVVKSESTKWLVRCPHATCIDSSVVTKEPVYAGFGVDRALNLRAAASKYGNPVLVIDAGSAITFTASNVLGKFVGGAILPGLAAQLKLLAEVEIPGTMPDQYAKSTAEATQSGVMKVALEALSSYIKPLGERSDAVSVVLTGGDSELLFKWIQEVYPELFQGKLIAVTADALSHYGMRWVYIQNNCCKDVNGGPGYLNAKFRKKFDGNFYDGFVREYLPPLDEEADTRPAWWLIQYEDGDREEVDEKELLDGMQLASIARNDESGSAQKKRSRKRKLSNEAPQLPRPDGSAENDAVDASPVPNEAPSTNEA